MHPIDVIKIFFHKNEKLRKKEVVEEKQLQDLMEKVISNKVPFMMGKIGGTELFALQTVEFHRKEKYRDVCEQGCRWSGIFPEVPIVLEKFVETMRGAIGEADLLLYWQKNYEAYFMNKYGKKLQGILRENIHTAWAQQYPWTKALKGKKVLVVHPFEKSIIKQYKRREKLFKNPDTLPEFELLTIKAVQSIGGVCEEGYRDWSEALDAMTAQIRDIDFDVALIGCGAYGLPLAARVKKMGKIAVHMGGDIQMLFGIMGKRWEDNPAIREIRKEYWVHPDISERPEAADKVEGGCYW